jgi:hypothetical protein
MVEKIYANMSACHMKNGNWKRAAETADKASFLGFNYLRTYSFLTTS